MELFRKRVSGRKLGPHAGPFAHHLDDAEPSEIDVAASDLEPQSSKWELKFTEPIPVESADSIREQIDAEALADMLSSGRSRVRQGFVFWSWMAATPLFGAMLIFFLLNGAAAWVPICLFGLATAYSMRKQATQIQRERSALRSADLDNRWLGPVCEALEWPDRHVRSVAELLAVQMLGRIKYEDGAELTEEQLNCLYQRLNVDAARRNPELARAVLRALPYVGTEPSLSFVERLAARGVHSVRSAAAATLALLERRISHVRRSQAADARVREAYSRRMAAEAEPDRLTDGQREEQAIIDAHWDEQMKAFKTALKSAQRPAMRQGFLIASWLIIVPYFVVISIILFSQRNFAAGLLTGALGLLSTQLFRLALSGRHKLVVQQLKKVDDVRCIGRWAETLEWPDREIRQLAIVSLTRLLKRVKATDKVFQNAGQRANLHRILTLSNARQNPEFLKAILAALEQVGDETAVPYVEQLAKSAPTSRGQRQVCEAASLCLDFVKSRAELSRSSQTLLRASAPTVMNADTLLRAAAANTAHDSEQLLRADAGAAR